MRISVLLTALCLLTIQKISAQQIMVETGKSITSFNFNDVNSVALQNLQSTTQNFVSFGYRHTWVQGVLYWLAGGGVNSYGSKGSDNSQNYFEWETTYLSFYGGLDFRFAQVSNMAFSLRATVAPEFIIQGNQTLNNQVYNVVGQEDFDKANLFFRGGFFVEYSLTYSMNLFAQYKYGISTQLSNPSLSAVQGKLQMKAHDIGFGLIITLDPKDTRKFRNRIKKANRIKN